MNIELKWNFILSFIQLDFNSERKLAKLTTAADELLERIKGYGKEHESELKLYAEDNKMYILTFIGIRVGNIWNTLQSCLYILNTGWQLAQIKEAGVDPKIQSQSKNEKLEPESKQNPILKNNRSDDKKRIHDKIKSSAKSHSGTLN